MEVGFLLLNLVLGSLTFLVFMSTRRFPSTLTPEHTQVLQGLACGVLVGSVLGIILPEGFEVQSKGGGEELSGFPVVFGLGLQLLLDAAANQCAPHAHHHSSSGASMPKHSPLPNAPCLDDDDDDEDEEEENMRRDVQEGDEMGDGAECLEADEEERRHRRKSSRLLSTSQLNSSATHAPAKSPGREVAIELSALGTSTVASHEATASDGSRRTGVSARTTTTSPHRHHHHHHHHASISSAEGFIESTTSSSSSPPNSNAHRHCLFQPSFIGLLVHCLADGMALGASSLSSTSLQWTVFFALTIHKLPVAFATGTYVAKSTAMTPRGLLQQHSYHHQQQRPPTPNRSFLYHALAFSLASPLAALLTHAILRHSTSSSSSGGSSFVGQALLFSGGTFLYVSVGHIMPELLQSQQHLKGASVARRWVVLLTVLIGMFAVPFLARLAPEHGH